MILEISQSVESPQPALQLIHSSALCLRKNCTQADHGTHKDSEVFYKGHQELERLQQTGCGWSYHEKSGFQEAESSSTEAAKDEVCCRSSEEEEARVYGQGTGYTKAEYDHPCWGGLAEREEEGEGLCG